MRFIRVFRVREIVALWAIIVLNIAMIIMSSVEAQTLPACTVGIPAADQVPSNETRLGWTKATFNDGSTITGESYVVASRAGSTGAFTDRCIATGLSAQMLSQPTGRNEYVIRTRLTGYADSANAGPVFKVNAPLKTLNPPTNFVVSPDNVVAWGFQLSRDRFALVPVGTVEPGTVCDTTQNVVDKVQGSKFVVPRASVVWAGSVRPQVVFASCG